MLLVFRPDSLRRIRQGKKRTTIRRNVPLWETWYLHRVREGETPWLQVYEGNPRNGGRRVCETALDLFAKSLGRDLDRSDAQEDGFESTGRLIGVLGELHGMNYAEILGHEWAILSPDMSPLYEALGVKDPGREWPEADP